MKLTLLILLIGVVSATQDLINDEVVEDRVSMEDDTEKETPFLRALKSGKSSTRRSRNRVFEDLGECKYDSDCNFGNESILKCNDEKYCEIERQYRRSLDDCKRNSDCVSRMLRCNKNNDECEVKPRYRDWCTDRNWSVRSRSRSGRRCRTSVKVAVAATDDGKENKCARKLRSNNSMTRYLDRSLNTRKMRDYGVVRVGDCSGTQQMKNRVKDLESRRSSTYGNAKAIVVVIDKDRVNGACKRALKNLSREIEDDLNCRDIRRMEDQNTDSAAENIVVVTVKSDSQCTPRRLKKKVLKATNLD